MLRRTFAGLAAAAPLLRGWQTAALPADAVASIEKLATAEMAAQNLPAISLAIGAGNTPVWSAAWGFADLEHEVRATPNTVFRTASVAKPITAAALMLLVEAGRFDLDADIRRWVPEFPEKPWTVTARQLLGHLGGIRWYRDVAEANSTDRYASLSEALAAFAADPLEHEPGTKYLYSSYGILLAGLAAERATGRPLAEYMRENVFGPLGMTRTELDDARKIIPHRARGYALGPDGGLRNSRYLDTSGRWPGGGLVATAEDLVRFARGLPRLLSPASLAAMWTPQRTRQGVATHYGLGWGVGEFDGRHQVSHGGAQSGFASVLRYLPEQRLAVAILINRQGAQHGLLADGVLRLLLNVAEP